MQEKVECLAVRDVLKIKRQTLAPSSNELSSYTRSDLSRRRCIPFRSGSESPAAPGTSRDRGCARSWPPGTSGSALD